MRNMEVERVIFSQETKPYQMKKCNWLIHTDFVHIGSFCTGKIKL